MRATHLARYLVLCALGLPGAGSRFQVLAQTARVEGSARGTRASPPDLFPAERRFSIQQPTKPLHLGEPNDLSVTLKGEEVTTIFVMQELIESNKRSPWLDGGDSEPQLQRKPDGQTYITIVPQRPGKLEVVVNVLFSDGGMDEQSTMVDVVAAQPPTAIFSSSAFGDVLTMALSEQGRRKFLQMKASYPGLKRPIPVVLDDAKFHITMDPVNPPIHFDPQTAEVKALQSGEALIETLYGGLLKTICVQVRENSVIYDHSKCGSLRAGGEQSAQAAQPSELKLPYGPMDSRTGSFLADERVELPALTYPLRIAENNPVVLKLNGPAIARIECHPDSGNVPCVPWTGDWSRQGLPFKRNADGTTTIDLFPMEFGKHTYTFFILFVDGGVALKEITSEVVGGAARPTSIGSSCTKQPLEDDLPIRLEPGQDAYFSKKIIVPRACYDGVRFPVQLPPTAVTYRVRNEGKKPVIDIDDSKGSVSGLRVGQALLQQSFGGFIRATCVVVAERDDPDASNCRRLRAKFGVPLPPLRARVKPPETADQIAVDEPGIPGGIGGIISLSSPSTISIQLPPLPVLSALAGARLSPSVRDRFNADTRLKINADGLVAELLEPTKLPVQISGPDVLTVSIGQQLIEYSGHPSSKPYLEPAASEERNADRIGREADGSTYLHLVALRTGTVEFHISVLFVDGGVATRTVRIPVKLPVSKRLLLLNVRNPQMRDGYSEASVLHLTTGPPRSQRNLYPALVVDRNRRAVALSPGEVQFILEQSDPIIQLDPKTGIVTALNPGRAVVRTRYASTETSTCIVVQSDVTHSLPASCAEPRD